MTEEKKGMPVWAWFAIGCAGLAVLVLVVVIALGAFAVKKVHEVAGDFEKNPEMAAARLVVKVNPELELVSENEDDGTMVVRDKKSGKEITVDVSKLAKGNFSFETEEGHVEISADEDNGRLTIESEKGKVVIGGEDSELPSWVPVPEGIEAESQFAMSDDASSKGGASLKGDLDVETLKTFYEKALADAGFKVKKNSFSGEGQPMLTLQGSGGPEGRTITVTITKSEGKVNAMIQYTEENGQ